MDQLLSAQRGVAGGEGILMLYPDLFKQLEFACCNMKTFISWSYFEAVQRRREQRAKRQAECHRGLAGQAIDAVPESRALGRLLHNLGLLLNQSFKTVQKINSYPQTPGRELAVGAVVDASVQAA